MATQQRQILSGMNPALHMSLLPEQKSLSFIHLLHTAGFESLGTLQTWGAT